MVVAHEEDRAAALVGVVVAYDGAGEADGDALVSAQDSEMRAVRAQGCRRGVCTARSLSAAAIDREIRLQSARPASSQTEIRSGE